MGCANSKSVPLEAEVDNPLRHIPYEEREDTRQGSAVNPLLQVRSEKFGNRHLRASIYRQIPEKKKREEINAFFFDKNVAEPADTVISKVTAALSSKMGSSDINMLHFASSKTIGGLGKFAADGTESKETIVSFQKGPMVGPLLKSSRGSHNVVEAALQAHKNITAFTGDRTSMNSENVLVFNLLQMCSMSELCRDEVYCQLMKHVTSNPSKESTLRGWQLLAICAGSFAPREDLMPYLLQFCKTHIKAAPIAANDPTENQADVTGTPSAETTISNLASRTQLAVLCTEAQGTRANLPTPVEIQATRDCVPFQAAVFKLDGSCVSAPVLPWVTVKEFRYSIMKKIGLKKFSCYRIYERCRNGNCEEAEETMAHENMRVADIVANWHTQKDTFQLVLKTFLFFDIEPDDHIDVEYRFVQGASEVLKNQYYEVQAEEDHIHIAAIHLQALYGDYSEEKLVSNVQGKLSDHCPPAFINEVNDICSLEEKVGQCWKQYCGGKRTSNEWMVTYLNFLNRFELYGAAFFFVQKLEIEENSLNWNNIGWPNEVVLAVTNSAIVVISPSEKTLSEFPYENVLVYGHTQVKNFETGCIDHAFRLVWNRNGEEFYFKCEDEDDILCMVHAYMRSKDREAKYEESVIQDRRESTKFTKEDVQVAQPVVVDDINPATEKPFSTDVHTRNAAYFEEIKKQKQMQEAEENKQKDALVAKMTDEQRLVFMEEQSAAALQNKKREKHLKTLAGGGKKKKALKKGGRAKAAKR